VSGAVIALAMTLNELCTNATKFGALSCPSGRIEIAWTIDDQNHRLHLTCTEKGGPAAHAPSKLRNPADRNARQAVEG
jgi:two-component sensor histidine kinase